MKFIKRFSLFEITLAIIILSIHLYAATSDAFNFPNAWFKRDDAYYYFKVAQNITEGHGSTFDGINLTNGYHPLWMLICIPIFTMARFDLILPLRILLMVMAGLQAASSILIYRLVKKYLSNAIAILAASFWAFNLYIHSTVYEYGLETPIAVFTILYLIYRLSIFEKEWRATAVTSRQLMELGLLAALVMFSRLDLVFFAVMAGIWVVFRGKMIRYLVPLDALIIFTSMTTSAALRTGIPSYNAFYASTAVQAAVLAVIIKLIALYFFGAYQSPRANPIWKNFIQVLFALTASTILLTAIFLIRAQIGTELTFPRSAFLVDWGISLLLIFLLRLAAYWFASPKLLGSESALSDLQKNWKIWLTESLSYYGVLGGLLAAYMLFNKLMFGTASPVSGQIKRWWGTMQNTIYEEPPKTWFAFFGIGRKTFNIWDPGTDLFMWLADLFRPLLPGTDNVQERYYIAMFGCILLGLILAFVYKKRTIQYGSKLALIPLIAGSGLQILSYTATAYGGQKEWYWVGELLLITLVGSFFLDMLLRPLLKIKFTRLITQTAAIGFFLLLVYNMSEFVYISMPHGYFESTRRPMDVLLFLEANTPPGSVIGMTGGGNVGYFINDRTIVNMDGLINSNDYFHVMKNGEAPTYLRKRGMTLVFANPQMLYLPPFHNQFGAYLEKYTNYGGKGLFYLLEEPKY